LQFNALHVLRVSRALAQHPDLGLAYDLFCSVIFDAGRIRMYSTALSASLSAAAKIFSQLLAADRSEALEQEIFGRLDVSRPVAAMQ
jgi:hypothetical protein